MKNPVFEIGRLFEVPVHRFDPTHNGTDQRVTKAEMQILFARELQCPIQDPLPAPEKPKHAYHALLNTVWQRLSAWPLRTSPLAAPDSR